MSLELWTAVERYMTDLIVKQDAALDAALAESNAAGLPPISVAPTEGKLLHVLAARRPWRVRSRIRSRSEA